MIFPYTRFSSYYIPVIPVTLNRGDRCIVTEALVDTGAARSIFDAQFVHSLGIDDLERHRGHV
jgi:predicted aspartyl protease